MDADQYTDQLKALLPVGRLWNTFREEGTKSHDLLLALGDEFEEADKRLNDLKKEIDPRTTVELLEEYEEFAGLPESCAGGVDETLESRRSELHSKLTSKGGQSISYLISRAADLGYVITINEVRQSVAGSMVAGDELVSEENNIFAFQVNTVIENTHTFTAGESVAGESLGYWEPVELECLLSKLKPSHTFILYNYLIPGA